MMSAPLRKTWRSGFLGKFALKFLRRMHRAVALIDFFYPKDDNLVILGSNAGMFKSGSPEALEKFFASNETGYEVHYFLPLDDSLSEEQRSEYILRFAPIFLKARYLIGSHPPADFDPFVWWSKRKIFIDVWHGIPLKAMFFSDKGQPDTQLKDIKRLNKLTSAFVVSSNLESALISKCFFINPRKIFCIGHPRNDILIKGERSKSLDEIYADLPDYDLAILYAPTYRRYSQTKFFPFTDMDPEKLSDFLESRKIIIFLRGHEFDMRSDTRYLNGRVLELGFDNCPDVNPILQNFDVLITDYSSIYLDFLLLNRPCLFIPYDYDEYRKQRGLLVDDYDYWTPGEKIDSLHQFMDAVDAILKGDDEFREKRSELIGQFHRCQSKDSGKRILELMDTIRISK